MWSRAAHNRHPGVWLESRIAELEAFSDGIVAWPKLTWAKNWRSVWQQHLQFVLSCRI
jgi:hypothetical protein